jgi:hypothetical protein
MIRSISNWLGFKAWYPKSRKAISVYAHHDRSVKLCPYRNKRPRSTQGAYFRSHTRSVNQCVKIRQGLPTDIPNHLLYFLHTHRRVQISQGLLINVPCHLLYFLHAQRHVQKERGYRSMYLSASITFSTCITAYKKLGAPDRCSIQLLLFSACTSLRTKSKGLHRYVLQI